MSLNTAKLIDDLRAVYTATYGSTDDKEAALERFLNDFAAALELYIKSAKVNYDGGLSAGSNPVIGTFNSHIS